MLIVVIGAGVGLAGGVFGKGGSAIATPLLLLAGVPPLAAVASPLPATIPSTVAALRAHARHGSAPDQRVVRWSIAVGVPASLAGSLLTIWVDASALLVLTEVLLVVIGVRMAVGVMAQRRGAQDEHVDGGGVADPLADAPEGPPPSLTRLALVAGGVGLISGLLASGGGFLLAPLFMAALGLPIKRAFASSLAVAAALAVPATVAHAALGNIDWQVVAVFGAASIPLSFLGGRVAAVADPRRLQGAYGALLVTIGVGFLLRD